jgi:hypothetical protein
MQHLSNIQDDMLESISKINFTIGYKICTFIRNFKSDLTNKDVQLLESIRIGDANAAFSILEDLYHVAISSHVECDKEYERKINDALVDALDKNDFNEVMQIFETWIKQTHSRPILYENSMDSLLLNPKYDETIIGFLISANYAAISVLWTLKYNMFRHFYIEKTYLDELFYEKRQMTAYEVFITYNNVTEETRRLFVEISIKMLEKKREIVVEHFNNKIFGLEEVHEYMETNGIEYRKEPNFKRYVLDIMCTSIREKDFKKFGMLLDQFQDVIPIDIYLSHFYLFLEHDGEDFRMHSFFQFALLCNSKEMIKVLIKRGVKYNTSKLKLNVLFEGIFEDINFEERSSLLMIEHCFRNIAPSENFHIQKYMFNEWILREVCTFVSFNPSS